MPTGSPPSPFDLLDHVPQGLVVLDRELHVLFWNACMEDWTGVSRGEILSHDIRDRYPHLGEPRYMRRLAELFEGGAPTLFSPQLHPHFIPSELRSGRQRVLQTAAVAIPNEVGGHYALLAMQDVTGLSDAMTAVRKARDEAQLLAATDPLTGVMNRRAFVDAAERTVAQAIRHDRPCSLLTFDIDRFKIVNDSFGHQVGDEVLRTLVGMCRQTLRESDILGRLGGDEFSALLPETPRPMAAITAERVLAGLVAEKLEVEGQKVTISVSIGVTALDESCRTVDALLSRADQALYEAKRLGRSRVIEA